MRVMRWFVLLSLLVWLNCRGRTTPNVKKDGAGTSDASVVVEQQPDESKTPAEKPIVLLISLDGLRWDYMELADAPNLQRLIKGGVKAESLIPVFPSKTFPNHYTIVTGLYPENHGIVSNSMFDPVFREFFRITDANATTNGKWWEGEPIWVTASKQGQTTATMFWPGSDAEIQDSCYMDIS